MSESGASDDGTDADLTPTEALVERAETDVIDFLQALLVDESIDDAEVALADLYEVAEEAEELLATVDLSEIPEAIDVSELPELIEAGDVPEAIASGDAGEAINVGALLDVVKLGSLWSSVDVREFWRNKREFEAALDDVTGDDGESDDGVLERMTEAFSSATDDEDGDGIDFDDVSDEVSTDAAQAALQSGLQDAIDKFYDGLLKTHRRLDELRAINEERTGNVGQPDSRNPTAFSTLPGPSSGSRGRGLQHSTVPRETKYSTTPNRERVYGTRFEKALEERLEDEDE